MTKEITSLAAFKRALEIGSEWDAEFWDGSQNKWIKTSPRTVAHVQTNAVAFAKNNLFPNKERALEGVKQNPWGRGSWLHHRSAKTYRFEGEWIVCGYFDNQNGNYNYTSDNGQWSPSVRYRPRQQSEWLAD